MPSKSKPLTPLQWKEILNSAGDRLSDDEKAIVRLLAERMSQKQIGERLGLNRSVVWRKAKAIAERHKTAP